MDKTYTSLSVKILWPLLPAYCVKQNFPSKGLFLVGLFTLLPRRCRRVFSFGVVNTHRPVQVVWYLAPGLMSVTRLFAQVFFCLMLPWFNLWTMVFVFLPIEISSSSQRGGSEPFTGPLHEPISNWHYFDVSYPLRHKID